MTSLQYSRSRLCVFVFLRSLILPLELSLEMGLKCGVGLVAVPTLLLVLISMAPSSLATARNAGGSGNWGFGFNHTDCAQRNSTIVVGGSEHWHFGFDYSGWAFSNGPFLLNDTLVFKYDPPNSTTFPHSVSLLKDFRSFMKCDFKGAKLVGNVAQGGGKGFEFVLKESKPYYFACGEHEGKHCTVGLMKFFVWPLKPQRG